MTFQLDTSGAVQQPRAWMPPDISAAWPNRCGALLEFVRWSDLSPFAQGTLEAASRDIQWPDPAEGFGPSSGVVRFDWWSPEALALILRDCEAWRAEFVGAIRETSDQRADMGAEFWRIRQESKRRTFPPLTPYLSDDGKVHLRESQ